MQVKKHSLALESFKYFCFIGSVVVVGWLCTNYIAARRSECQMVKGFMVKGTCIYPR